MKKLINELSEYVTMIRRDVKEGYMYDASLDIEDILGIACQIQEGIKDRLNG